MSIRYITNDPAADPRLENTVQPTGAPSGLRARFSYSRSDPEDIYPLDDDPAFVYWQCQEAAHRVLSMWESLAGPVRLWQNGQRLLPINFDNGAKLQAVYDRSRIVFYRFPLTSPETHVAASSDAVAHEVGHAILDALRPDLWESPLPEVAAFHEGFSDCIALLAALHDEHQLTGMFDNEINPAAVLQGSKAPSAISESIAKAARIMNPLSNPVTWPRQCRNKLKWDLPTSVMPTATRENLSSEPHSFGRIFAGCCFDLVSNVYTQAGMHDQQGLLQAAGLVGTLLGEAVKVAPKERRFFQAVARTMIHVDKDLNAGTNHLAISDAFARHNIALGSSAMLAPSTPLDGPPPSVNASGASSTALVAETRHSLCDVLGESRTLPIRLRPVKIGRQKVSSAGFSREVSLDALDRGLEGVSAVVRENVLLGKSRARGAVLGQVPNAAATRREVETMADILVKNGCINGVVAEPVKVRKGFESIKELPTHSIRKQGGGRRIKRVRFTCSG